MSACDRRRPGAGERDRDNDGGSPLSFRSKALHILPTARVRGLPRQRIPASRGQIRALQRLILRLPRGFRTRGDASGVWQIVQIVLPEAYGDVNSEISTPYLIVSTERRQ